MAVAQGILIAALSTILSGLLPAGFSTDLFAGLTAPSLQSPRDQLRNPLPPAVRPKPARPGIDGAD